MPKTKIRPISIGVFRRGEQILVQAGYDRAGGRAFFRPPGGKIDFGEHSAETLRREMREELGAEITGMRFLGVIESLFNYEGKECHEHVFVYEARFADPALYASDELIGIETGDRHDHVTPIYLSWVRFSAGDEANAHQLVPAGLFELVYGDPMHGQPGSS